MEVTCTICKHYSRTMEEHDRHIQSEAHKTNAEIYEMGLEAGEFKSSATIARLRGLLEKLQNVVLLPSPAWNGSGLHEEVRRELSRSGSESEEE